MNGGSVWSGGLVDASRIGFRGIGGFCDMSPAGSWLVFRDGGSVPCLGPLSGLLPDIIAYELSVNLPILSLTDPTSGREADSESEALWSMRPAAAAVSMVSLGLFSHQGRERIRSAVTPESREVAVSFLMSLQ